MNFKNILSNAIPTAVENRLLGDTYKAHIDPYFNIKLWCFTNKKNPINFPTCRKWGDNYQLSFMFGPLYLYQGCILLTFQSCLNIVLELFIEHAIQVQYIFQ